ncbi:molybdopterin-binding protein [Corynebacterium sp. L4756]|uniref:molybdopterin-binding protein n=1 Tax=unclassified Corynebacterium TaxID=2624378 RepID=UPI00374CC352
MSPTTSPPTAALIVVSDRIVDGTKENCAADTAAKLLSEANIALIHREVVREEECAITSALDTQLDQGSVGADIIITLGGTGTRLGNVVPEVTEQRIAARLHGLETQVLLKGLQSSPKAGLCRGIIGVTHFGHPTKLIINSAGSRGAVSDTLDVVLPLISDIFRECSTEKATAATALGR